MLAAPSVRYNNIVLTNVISENTTTFLKIGQTGEKTDNQTGCKQPLSLDQTYSEERMRAKKKNSTQTTCCKHPAQSTD